MNQGKNRRLKRIMQGDNRTVIVPMDHGVTVGPIHKGIAKHVDSNGTGLIVMLSGMSNLSPNVNGKVQVCSVQEAIRLGADAVSVHVNIGAQDEDKMLQNMGKVADECDQYGMPLLAMMYPRGPNPKRACARSGCSRSSNRRRTRGRHNQSKLHRQHRLIQKCS